MRNCSQTRVLTNRFTNVESTRLRLISYSSRSSVIEEHMGWSCLSVCQHDPTPIVGQQWGPRVPIGMQQ